MVKSNQIQGETQMLGKKAKQQRQREKRARKKEHAQQEYARKQRLIRLKENTLESPRHFLIPAMLTILDREAVKHDALRFA